MIDADLLPSFRLDGEEVFIEALGTYYQTSHLALVGRSRTGEQLLTLTVNLTGAPDPAPGAVWLKVWGENAGLAEALEEAELGVLSGRVHDASRFVKAYEFTFGSHVWNKLADSLL